MSEAFDGLLGDYSDGKYQWWPQPAVGRRAHGLWIIDQVADQVSLDRASAALRLAYLETEGDLEDR